jgi:ParB-like nuclease family protein
MDAVRVKVREIRTLDHDKLTPFQGELKNLSEENYQKVKGEILRLGFSFALHAWVNDQGRICILDGHQRITTLKRMKQEGFEIPKIPVVMVEADNYQDAKQMVLAGTSQYGEMQEQGLYDFIAEAGLDWRQVADSCRFPEIDMSDFASTFFGENGEQGSDENPEGGPTDERQHIVSIHCKDEAAMNEIYSELQERGFECRLIT